MRIAPSLASSALAVLTLAALALRWVGIGYMLPYRTEPDNHVLGQLEIVEPGTIDLPRDELLSSAVDRCYPWLLARVLQAWPAPVHAQVEPSTLADELAGLAAPFRRAREAVAAVGILIVPATFFLAARFVGSGYALLAAALVATSLLHVNFSQQCRPHVLLGALAALALLADLRLLRHGRLSDHALAWVATVLAIGSLHNGVLSALPLGAAYLLRSRSPEPRRWAPLWPAIVMPGSALALAMLAFYPAVGSSSTWPVLTQHVMDPAAFDGTGFLRLAAGVAAYDPLLVALAVLGLIALDARGLRREPGMPRPPRVAEALVLASYALPYLVVFGAYSKTLERYAIPLLPFLALLAALAVRGAVRLIGSHVGHPRVLAATLAAGIMILPTWAAVKLAVLRSRPDSLAQAALWIEGNVDPSDTVYLSPGFDLPLIRTKGGPNADMGSLRFPWHDYQAKHARVQELGRSYCLRYVPLLSQEFRLALQQDPASAIRGLDADYVVMGMVWHGPVPAVWRQMNVGLARTGEYLTSIVPVAHGGNVEDPEGARPLLYEDCYLLSVLRASMVGPVIRIYRIRS